MPHVTLVWTIGILAVLAGCWFALSRLQGHASAPDGVTFTCRVQPLDRTFQPATSKWFDANAVAGPGWVELYGRGVAGGRYAVLGESGTPPKGRAVFALERGDARYVLSVPEQSPAAARLRGQDPGAP